MSRIPALALALLVPALAWTTAAGAQSSSTIRIEPRNIQGATVSLENGVRVWRPLPATRYVVVNPGGRTPLALGLELPPVGGAGYGPGNGHGYAPAPGPDHGYGYGAVPHYGAAYGLPFYGRGFHARGPKRFGHRAHRSFGHLPRVRGRPSL